ncbi:DUF2339 domain-containing protein [Paragemmobacter ruber]|uniref:DUF2339 domain-containing protein n=1 Tax=Paragemmobacter ruber TaxID=1985673 RepID=A0ABW9Y5A3_9RHOB|nr:DUF2339 domain-containing protein [Rhodobacter ruber]NBE07716.1 DUF2339 domain-containing protein [Rhodobacter ruber]
MEAVILGLLAVLAIPVGLIVLWVRVSGMRREIAALTLRLTDAERRLAQGGAPGGARAGVAVAALVDEVGPWRVAETVVAEANPPDAAPVAEVAEAPNPAPTAAVAPTEAPEAARRPAPPLPPAPRGPGVIERFGSWLVANWVYAVSGVSLALAGVFLVQYGMERGFLPPALRVLAAIGFGLGLIYAGERVRRRFGDGEASSTAYLPSVFSGAGLVSIFAAVLAARQLYDLIGAEVTFAALVATAAGAVVLGWFHGPLLAALGLTGAVLSPFMVGGSSDSVDWLQGYFLLVAAAGLAVDAVRRWAWVSGLAVALAAGAGMLLLAGGGAVAAYQMAVAVLALMSVGIPALRLFPDHAGPTVLQVSLILKGGGRPIFPVMLAWVVMAVAVAALVLFEPGAGWGLLPFVLLAGLAVALALWTGEAPGLQDLPLVPAAGFVALVALAPERWSEVFRAFEAALQRAPETAAPWTVTWLVVLSAGVSVALAFRAGRGAVHPVILSIAGALAAPVTALVLELTWPVAAVIGAYPWALQVMALAALMVGLAMRFARADGGDLRRAAHFGLSALALIALALFLILSKAALSFALAVLVAVAAGLDRRLRLPEMALAVQAGVVLLGWRMAVDPGLFWAFDAPLIGAVAAYVGPILGLGAALWLLPRAGRDGARAFAESGIALALVLLADVLLLRWISGDVGYLRADAHWSMALVALPWLAMALVQLYRVKLGGRLALLRYGLAGVAGVIWGLGMLVAVTLMNPLFGFDPVRGPLLVDSLFVAYGLAGLVILLARRFLRHLPLWLRRGLDGLGVALVAIYAGLEIRRFWRGDDLSVPGTSQPELYSYTIALLIVGAVLLWQAIARSSVGLRRLALGLIGVTVAKVFLVDAAGLSGLMRVFSFLALGLSLAGLAWLNRWAALRAEGGAAK